MCVGGALVLYKFGTDEMVNCNTGGNSDSCQVAKCIYTLKFAEAP